MTEAWRPDEPVAYDNDRDRIKSLANLIRNEMKNAAIDSIQRIDDAGQDGTHPRHGWLFILRTG